MNFKTTGIIIRHEYLTRVKKKSFLVTTFVVPLLFAAMCILPPAIMFATKEDHKTIAVIDKSGIVMPFLTETETVSYVDKSDSDFSQLKAELKTLGFDALLNISDIDTVSKCVSAETFSEKPLGVEMSENINGKINDAIESYRVSSYNIENLDTIMEDVKSNVKMTSYTFDEEGKETLSESGVYMVVSMILGMIIYLFISLFAGMVMNSVIEEKASRVVEVLISSVKSTELMFGKILGVGLVAITQFLLWIILTFGIITVAGSIFGADFLTSSSDPTQMMASMGADPEALAAMGVDVNAIAQGQAVTADGSTPSELDVVMSTVKSLPVVSILISFFMFFVFGFFLYASLFAAVGSAGESAEDTQQLQLPLTIPLLIGFFIAFYANKAPDSGLVFWGSMIPFTSPIVMLARIPYGVAAWELILSIVLLVGTFIACAFVSSKIYKVGILMFGKKNSFKDLWRWLKMK